MIGLIILAKIFILDGPEHDTPDRFVVDIYEENDFRHVNRDGWHKIYDAIAGNSTIAWHETNMENLTIIPKPPVSPSKAT